MQEVKSSKFNDKYTKNWHQTGWTLGAVERLKTEDEYLSQILCKLGNDSIELKGYASLGIKDLAALTPHAALKIKQKPGRKPKDTGRSKRSLRTYSAAQANNIASYVFVSAAFYSVCVFRFVCVFLFCLQSFPLLSAFCFLFYRY